MFPCNHCGGMHNTADHGQRKVAGEFPAVSTDDWAESQHDDKPDKCTCESLGCEECYPIILELP